MIKLYFNAKPLFLCDAITPDVEDYLHRPDAIFIDEFNHHTVATMIYEMQQDNIYAGVFLHNDLEELLNAFKKSLTLVQAAGGFVQSNDHVLLIFRRGKWDLPKGKLDEGEDLKQCAIREVQEETGLQKVEIIKPLKPTYHTYHEKERFILKESHWFLMQSPKMETLTPQQEEDIEKCQWVKIKDLAPFMENTFPSILDVVHNALEQLPETKKL